MKYEASYLQYNRRYRFGDWQVQDDKLKRIAVGPKGKMQQLAKLLNDEEVRLTKHQ